MEKIVWFLEWAWAILIPVLLWLLRRGEKVDEKAEKAIEVAELAQKLAAETRVILAERHMTKSEVEAIVDRTFHHLVDVHNESSRNIHNKLDDLQKDIKMLTALRLKEAGKSSD